VDALALRVAVVVLAFALPAWILLSLVIVLGRLRYERSRRKPTAKALGPREADRLIRRVSRNPRTEWRKWRRVAALARLEEAHHPAVPRLIRAVLADPDPRIAAAAVRTLGDIGDDWAIDLHVHGSQPRSSASRRPPGRGSWRWRGTGILSFGFGEQPSSGPTRSSVNPV